MTGIKIFRTNNCEERFIGLIKMVTVVHLMVVVLNPLLSIQLCLGNIGTLSTSPGHWRSPKVQKRERKIILTSTTKREFYFLRSERLCRTLSPWHPQPQPQPHTSLCYTRRTILFHSQYYSNSKMTLLQSFYFGN